MTHTTDENGQTTSESPRGGKGWEGLNPPYRTIVADPPWPYEQGFVNGPARGRGWSNRKKLPYEAMTTQDIADLDVGALADPAGCWLFLWTTNRYLPFSFDLLRVWGFDYAQMLVWHKGDASPFPASIAPNSAEFILVAKSPGARRIGTVASSVLTVNRGPHSVKPAAFFDLVERVSPGPYVELFARQPRLGWDHWGYGIEGVA